MRTRLGAPGQRPLGSGSGEDCTSVSASELGADRQSWGVWGKNASVKSLKHVGRPGGSQKRHLRSEAMNASGEGDSFSGSVQSKCWVDGCS